MTKILILGAGIYQVPLITAARALGCHVIVSSIKGNYPGFALADKVYYENTTDEDAIIKLAQTEKIDGIATTGTDVAMKALGRVTSQLGLPGPSYESALASSDKLVMKQKFESNGVNTARYRSVKNSKEAKKAVEELGVPVILKITDSSGSRGIKRIDAEHELEAGFEEVFSQTSKDHLIIESFIDGIEFGAQAMVQDGKLLFCLPHGDMMHMHDPPVPIGHYVPFNLEIPQLESQLFKAIKALGLDNCAINADMIWKDGKIYFLEIAGRAGATCLPEIVSLYYGINYYDLILKVAFGREIEESFSGRGGCGAELIISRLAGEIESLNYEGNPDFLNQISFDYGSGDKINAFKVGPDRIGQIVVKGESQSNIFANLAKVKEGINLKLKQQP